MRFLLRTTPLLAVALLAAAALPAAGQASARQVMTFEAPNELLSDQQRTATLDEIRAFGVTRVRQLVYWQQFAPRPNARRRPSFDATDPAAYPAGTWDRLDRLVIEAGARGIQVQMTLTGPVPRWATSTRRGHVTRPNVREFARWVTAVGRRYGDRVSQWSIWNEPNSAHFLAPQTSRGRAVSPRLYRALYRAGVKALRAMPSNRRDTMLLGETAPRGNPRTTRPLPFLRGVLCLNRSYRPTRRCAKLDAQGYAHHAYTTRTGPRFRPPAGDVTIGVLGRLTGALNRAGRAGAIRRRMPVYLTEFGIQTYPDRISGVPQATQPAYLAIAEHIAYVNPRVKQFSQYLMRDDRRRRSGYRYGGFETGLRTASGRKKPSYRAFPIPLAVERFRSRDVLWGFVRPYRRQTTVVIQRRLPGRAWRHLRTVTTGATGVYTLRAAHRRGVRYRVRWTAPDGSRRVGPPIAVH